LKDFIAHPLADSNALALLDAYREYDDGRDNATDDLIVHPQVSDPELPGGQSIRSERLAIARRDGRLISELLVNRIEYERSLSGGQCPEMPLRVLRVLDSISHGVRRSPAVSSRRVATNMVLSGPVARA